MSFFRLDFLGMRPNLLVSGHKRYRTKFGVFMSIVTFSFIMAFFLYFCIRLFQRQVFTVNQNPGNVSFPVKNLSKMPIILKTIDGSLQDISNDPRYFQYEILFSHTQGNQFIHYIPELETCDIDKHFGEFRSYFTQIKNLSTYTCVKDLPNYNITLYGIYGDLTNGYSTMDFLLNFCDNATMNNSCAQQSDINARLKSIFVSFGFLDYNVDNNNIEDPVSLSLQIQLLPMSSTIFTRYFFLKRSVSYLTDYGYVFPDPVLLNFFQQDKKESYNDLSINLGGDNAVKINGVKFGQISILMNQNSLSYVRSYYKIQDLMASIGGVMSAVMFVGYTIVNFVAKRMYLLHLANIFFTFHKEKILKRARAFEMAEEMKMKKILCSTERDLEMLNIKERAPSINRHINQNLESNMTNSGQLLPNRNSLPQINKNEGDLLPVSPGNILHKDEFPEQKTTSNLFSEVQNKTKTLPKKETYSFENRVNEFGNLNIGFMNVFCPNAGVKKIMKIVKKKISIDEILKYCSQLEKIKKFLFENDELIIFNHLPDLDFKELQDILYVQSKTIKENDLVQKSLTKISLANPDSKLLKMMLNC